MNKCEPVEKRMNCVCSELGIRYQVEWKPCEHEKHGVIDTTRRKIIIFSKTEEEAWRTLFHEALELKIRPLLASYRELVNLLISFIEKHVYLEKEKFLEEIPKIMIVLNSEMEKANAHE